MGAVVALVFRKVDEENKGTAALLRECSKFTYGKISIE